MSWNRRFLRTNTATLIVLVTCFALLFGVLRHRRDASPVRETLRRLSDGDAAGRFLAAQRFGDPSGRRDLTRLDRGNT